MSINRNKQSICVDFHKESGRQLIVDLAKKSDVLLENYLPGKLDEIGLGYDQLKAVNPRLIYCSYVHIRMRKSRVAAIFTVLRWWRAA
jgi:succinate--hydroxymethylglutarate CoA-transferase